MRKRISIFSFFSGVGILDLAFEKNGYDIVYVNEFDPAFLESYQSARKLMGIAAPKFGYANCSVERFAKNRGKKSLMKLMEKERKRGNWVGFIGGPPCPDFSVAGKNAGANGTNGKLTKTYFDIICRCKPDFFLFENVRGLVKTEKHRQFYDQMKCKVKANAYIIDDKILNALEYGVPQFRERIFMVGICNTLIKTPQEYINDDGQLVFNWAEHQLFYKDDILRRNWPIQDVFGIGMERKIEGDILRKLTVQYWFNKNNVAEHQNNIDVFAVKAGLKKFQNIAEGDTKGKSFKRLHRWRYSPTAAYGHNEVHLHPYEARRISVAEAMAIQSLPKEFVLPPNIPLSKKFKMIGNGVPYLLASAIAKTLKVILIQMQEDDHEKDYH